MVSTLIKHEIKRTARWLGTLVLAAGLIVGAATVGATLVPNPFGGLLAGLAVGTALLLPAAVQLWQGIDFYRSSYTKTGYLTRALPVKSSTIFWVKLAYAYVVALLVMGAAAGLGLVAAIGMANATGGSAADVTAALRDFWALLTGYVPGWLWVVAILVILSIPLSGLATYYLAASVGSEAWAGRLGIAGPIIVWFATYVASQIVSLVGLCLPMNLVFPDGRAAWSFDPMILFKVGEDAAVIPMGSLLLVTLLTLVAIAWAAVSFDRRVELR